MRFAELSESSVGPPSSLAALILLIKQAVS